MILRNFLSSERCKCISESVQNLVGLIGRRFGNPQWAPHLEMKNVEELLLLIDASWRTDVKHRMIAGRPCAQISIIQKCNNYNFERDFIGKEIIFTINHKKDKFNRMNYDYTTYRELCYMQTAMCIYKYRQELSAEEITVIAIKTLLRYIKVYTYEPYNNYSLFDYVWQVKNGKDVNNIVNEILDSPCSIFNSYLYRIDSNYKIEYIPDLSIGNPFESDEIKAMLINGSSKEDLVLKLMEMLNCSRATAYRKLKKEGLTRAYARK